VIYAVVCLSLLLILAIFYCVKFGVIILRVQDTLEETLDVIDEKYAAITEICERPLFYDSPEVKRVLEDIKSVRNALHGIAYALTENFEGDEEVDRVEGDANN
jgi:hypothetical protein